MVADFEAAFESIAWNYQNSELDDQRIEVWIKVPTDIVNENITLILINGHLGSKTHDTYIHLHIYTCNLGTNLGSIGDETARGVYQPFLGRGMCKKPLPIRLARVKRGYCV